MGKHISIFLISITLSGCGGGGSGGTDLEPGLLVNIKGTDSDSNGIRDDIDDYISTLQLPENKENAAMQVAKSLQETLIIDAANQGDVDRMAISISEAIHCLSTKVTNAAERERMIFSIENKTANTDERIERYTNFNHSMVGSVTGLLSGDTCND